jgi:hypothetical protein
MAGAGGKGRRGEGEREVDGKGAGERGFAALNVLISSAPIMNYRRSENVLEDRLPNYF